MGTELQEIRTFLPNTLRHLLPLRKRNQLTYTLVEEDFSAFNHCC